jgi:hypothetical protein
MIKQAAVIAPYDIHCLHLLMAGRPDLCEVQIIPHTSINFGFQNVKKNNILKLSLNLVSPYQQTPSFIDTLNAHPFQFDYIKTNNSLNGRFFTGHEGP